MEPYAGFQLLEKFEKSWRVIGEEDLKTGKAARHLATTLSSASKTYLQFGERFRRLNDAIQSFHSLVESVDNITQVLGRLEGTFDEVEEVMSLLESIYEEEDTLNATLSVVDESYSLKIRREKELESLKARLAKGHSDALQAIETRRQEKRKSAAEALQSAIWKFDQPTSDGDPPK